MAKLTAPALAPGPRKELSDALHALHRQAGWLSVRELARVLGDPSSSRIHDAFTKPRLPAWGLVELIVRELAPRLPDASVSSEVKRFHGLWDRAAEAEGDAPPNAQVAHRNEQPALIIEGPNAVLADSINTPGQARRYLYPTLRDVSNSLQIQLDHEEDESFLTIDAENLGKLYAQRWISRLRPDREDLLFLLDDYPKPPIMILKELYGFAREFGFLTDPSTEANDEERTSLLKGFWNKVRDTADEDPFAQPHEMRT